MIVIRQLNVCIVSDMYVFYDVTNGSTDRTKLYETAGRKQMNKHGQNGTYLRCY